MKIKAALVGCGGICNAWLEPAAKFEDLEIVGLVDLDAQRAGAVKEKYKLETAATGTSLEAIIDQTRPDVVFDLTVPSAHHEVTVKALGKGCHVLGEKPMADTMEHARQMVKAARKAKKIYAVIQNRRYINQIVQYRDLVNSGSIGQLTTLNADFYIGAHFGGFRDVMDHVLVLDMAIHSFDQARYISKTDPVSVYCHEWNPAGSWYKHGASAVAIFEMTNGVVFTYRGSWCAEGLNSSWECDWRAIGSKGSATWNGADLIKAEKVVNEEGFFRKKEEVAVPAASLPLTTHAALIREFLDCVKNGGTPQTSCEDNIKSLAMVHAAIKSATTGKKVAVKV